MAKILTADELNTIAKGSGYKGGSFSNIGLPKVSPILNSQNTQPTPKITLPKTQPDMTNYQGIVSGATAYTTPSGATVDAQGNVISQPKTETPVATPYTDKSKGIMSKIEELLGGTQGKEAYQQEQLQTSGALELEKRQREVASRLTALNTEAQAIPLQIQDESLGRGRTATGVAPLQADAQRKNAIQALSLQAEYAVNQGSLETARAVSQRAVDLKYKDIETQLDQQSKLLELYLPLMSKEEQKQAETQALKNEQTKIDLGDKKKLQQDLINSFQENGQGQLASQVITLDPNSPTFTQDIARLQSQLKLKVTKTTTPTGSTGKLSGTTQAIINNPSLFDDLTPTVRGQVLSELQANGYGTSNLGVKGLSDTAINSIAQTQKALSDLGDLKAKIEGKTDLLGPITGLQALNPYSSARQLQADVDRVRQTVGKALEGGVLRKEDEEKYKKILATLTDTPTTAIYKIDALISSIQRDIENYKSLQQSSGRSIDVGAPLQKAGSTVDFRSKYNY